MLPLKINKIHMKNIVKLLLIITGAVAIYACEDEFEVPGDPNFADPAAAGGPNEIEVSNFISFADLSQGAKSRAWTVPETAEILNDNGATSSSLPIIHVQFNQPGEFEVNLSTIFNNPNINFDSAFTITVLDSIATAFEAGEVTGNNPVVGPDKITLEAGSQIVWNDMSTGNPDAWSWFFEGGDPPTSTEQVPTVQYKSLGVFDVGMVSRRESPFGRPDTLWLQDYIEVIPSTEPIVINSANENAEDVIELVFSRNLQPAVFQVSNFTLTVDGAAAEISSIGVSTTDLSILNVIPAVPLKNTQTASLSYNGNGVLQSSDFVKAEAFEDLEIMLYAPNLFTDNPGFEDGNIDAWGALYGDATGGASMEAYNGDAHSGAYSLRVVMDDATAETNLKLSSEGSEFPFKLEEGKVYRLEFWIKVIDKFNEITVRTQPVGGWADYKMWNSGGNCCGVIQGEWVKRSTYIKLQPTPADPPPPFPETYEQAKLEFHAIDNDGARGEFLIDDIKIFEEDQ